MSSLRIQYDSSLHGCNCKVCESTTIKRKKGEIHIDRIVISKGHDTSPNTTQLWSLKGGGQTRPNSRELD